MKEDPYVLFPKCPSCNAESWHIGVERERKRRADAYIEEVEASPPGCCLFFIWIEIIGAIGFCLIAIVAGSSGESTSENWQVVISSLGAIVLMLFLWGILKWQSKKTMCRRLDGLTNSGEISSEERNIIEEQLGLTKRLHSPKDEV